MKKILKYLLAIGAALLVASVHLWKGFPPSIGNVVEEWQLLADDVTATVYNADPSQCNDDYTHTASNYALNMDDIASERIIAIERTMLERFNLAFGDIILVEGAGSYDGEWRVEDLMNKRFKGQNRIDFLVPQNIQNGKWHNLKIYTKVKCLQPKTES